MSKVRRFRVTVNGKQYEVEVEQVEEQESLSVPEVRTSAAAPPVQEVSPPPPAVAPAPVAAGEGQMVTAPLPGMVLDIKVAPGVPVRSGQVVAILEAMKMENEIVAPAAGTVGSVLVGKGSQVNAGDGLLTIVPG